MNLLKYPKAEIERLVKDGIATVDAIRHWDICKALENGLTIERVADDFKVSFDTVKWVKRKKCRCSEG